MRLRPWLLVLLCLACATLRPDAVARAWKAMLAAQAAGNLEQAAALAAEARAALPASERTSSRALAIVERQGRIALARNLPAEAEAYFGELRARVEAGRGAGDPALAYPLCELAKLRAARGDRDDARELWTRVLALGADGARAPDEQRAFAFAGLARLARDEGRADEADRLFRQAITQGSTTSEPFWEIRRDYAELLRALGRRDEAERVEAGVGPSPSAAKDYLWNVLRWRYGLDPFDERAVLRWADERMPLRVYVPSPPPGAFPGTPPEAIRQLVRDAVVEWKDVARPGVPAFVFVDRARKADLRFEWREVLPDLTAAETRLPTEGGALQVVPIHLATRWDPRVGASLDGLAVSIRHEVGHALGLAGHSPDPGDLMAPTIGHADEAGRHPTARDRETLRLLYGYAPGQVIERHSTP